MDKSHSKWQQKNLSGVSNVWFSARTHNYTLYLVPITDPTLSKSIQSIVLFGGEILSKFSVDRNEKLYEIIRTLRAIIWILVLRKKTSEDIIFIRWQITVIHVLPMEIKKNKLKKYNNRQNTQVKYLHTWSCFKLTSLSFTLRSSCRRALSSWIIIKVNYNYHKNYPRILWGIFFK